MAEQSKREKRLELILSVFLELNKAYSNASSLEEYLEQAHSLLQKLMFAKNFYLARYNAHEHTIRFIYNVDEIDDHISPNQEITLASANQSPTAWVIANKQKLVMHISDEPRINEQGEAWGFGTKANQWIGMPLVSRIDECLGAVVIQSYDANNVYSSEDITLFKLFASMIAIAIEKHSIDTKLQATLAQRTAILEKELAEKKQSEKLQKALFQIAEISTKSLSLDQLYKRVHEIVNSLIYAKNFYIALLSEEQHEISLPYFIDERDVDIKQGAVLPVGKGISSYVFKTRKPQLLTRQKVNELVQKKEIEVVMGAQDFTCWLGVPMISSNMLHGIIVIQSYDEKVIFSQSDLQLLDFVAHHVANAIEATINAEQRKEAQLKLAKQHRVLEEQHRDQKEMLLKLQRTQQKLIQQEKMASLGGLVAGISHEINTPLGICVTGVSHLYEEYKVTKQALLANELTEKQLNEFFDEVKDTVDILKANTEKAADLVQSFKRVAVDQSSNNIRDIRLNRYIHDVILSLRPTLKRVQHDIIVQCDDNLTVKANAGVISQILSNLILNAIKHGFEGIEKGHILINVTEKKGSVILRFADDGIGVDKAGMKKLFDPFYTTKRGAGGSGLGTHLVFNLVSSALNGTIEAKSEPGKGLAYMIKFPLINGDE